LFTRIQTALALSFVALSLSAGRAHASNGLILPGSTVCTDKLLSNSGVLLYGNASRSERGTWTVLMSSTTGGPETEIFRKIATVMPTTHVKQPTAGTFHFRTCLNNGGAFWTGFRINMSKGYGSTVDVGDIGPDTMTVTPGEAFPGIASYVCSDFARDRARRVGQSTAPVKWYIRTFDDDMNMIDQIFVTTAANVDEVIESPYPAYLMMCVENTSNTTATISFELTQQ